MISLARRKCIHRSKQSAAPSQEQLDRWMEEIDDWSLKTIRNTNVLQKSFSFSNFTKGIEFAVRLGELADKQDHHPELTIEWGKVRVRWWTHTMLGLSENDFIMAAKVDKFISAPS